MDPKQLFLDDRFVGVCCHCGASANTRDHVPSRVLLDEPYPTNLAISESCDTCNQGFSNSEEFVACLIEYEKQKTTEPSGTLRPKIAKILAARPTILQRILHAKNDSERTKSVWQTEESSVREVVLKLARGHIAYELGLQLIEEPSLFEVNPIPFLTQNQVDSFSEIESKLLYPEIGSRSFVNLLKIKPTAYGRWNLVQELTYRYCVGQGSSNWVKIVIGEYLACSVAWE